MDKLKRTLFSTFALLAFVAFALGLHTTHAQNQPDALYLGFQGGLAQSSFEGDDVESSSRQGFTGGVQFMYNLNEALSAELDVHYTKQGADEVTASGGPNTSDAFDYSEDRVTIDYLSFPILFKLTAPIEAVKLRAMAGPSISFLTGAKENGFDTQRALQSQPSVKDRFLLYDLSGIVGGEIAYPLPGLLNGEVAIDGRYNFGFMNVDQTQGFTLKNRSFSGSLILRFQVE